MQPRAFVIMPFGVKNASELNKEGTNLISEQKIDFDAVYENLLKPALEHAGYEVARADSAKNAGDIRTDMFFELVTADLVVADVSILNANVYYELGVRHGVCPNGVFIVNGSLMSSRPFDIAPDRSFNYDTALFLTPALSENGAVNSHVDPAVLAEQRRSLAKRFSDAIALDRETVGSPVYAHLPGLKPVNWNGIETSKAKYFNALQSDWLDCVRNAQRNGHPGDILTLAMNAPTRLHETRILYQAAIELIDLCRYAAAERVLRNVIRLDPGHEDAQLQLARVLSHLDKNVQAEQQLRKILRDHKDIPLAADLLGQVFRQLWYLSWKNEPLPLRRQKACEAAQLAKTAIHNFSRAHRADPAAFFAGFNAIMLAYILKQIGISFEQEAVSSINFSELQTIVRYVATNQQEHALSEGNYVQQFWCTTTLSGIHLINGEYEKALGGIREACAIPAATSFQLQTFRDRLELLANLNVQVDFVQQALQDVNDAMRDRNNHCSCQRVFLWAGYPIDHPADKRQRFTADDVHQVAQEIDSALREWGVGLNDLAICSGMTESDILFAECCLQLGARVRIMLRAPTCTERTKPLWPLEEPDWRKRFHQLLQPGDQKEIWVDTAHLGLPPTGSAGQDSVDFVTQRHNQWLLNTACMEAEPKAMSHWEWHSAAQTNVSAPESSLPPPTTTVVTPRLYGLFLWDGSGNANDAKDIPFFIRQISDYATYHGQVKIIATRSVGVTRHPEQTCK